MEFLQLHPDERKLSAIGFILEALDFSEPSSFVHTDRTGIESGHTKLDDIRTEPRAREPEPGLNEVKTDSLSGQPRMQTKPKVQGTRLLVESKETNQLAI